MLCLSMWLFFPPFLTSATGIWSDIFFRGLISLFLRWMWYIFSAATHDLGLSSGGMVIPYSQPGSKTYTWAWTQILLGSHYLKKKGRQQKSIFQWNIHVTFFIYSPVDVKAPFVLPAPSRWAFKLSWALSLFSILHNKDTHYVMSSSISNLNIKHLHFLWLYISKHKMIDFCSGSKQYIINTYKYLVITALQIKEQTLKLH